MPLTSAERGVAPPSGFAGALTRSSSPSAVDREDETDVRVFQPPRLERLERRGIPGRGFPGAPPPPWWDEDQEARYGACRGEGCCYVELRKIYDPSRGAPIEIIVTVCP